MKPRSLIERRPDPAAVLHSFVDLQAAVDPLRSRGDHLHRIMMLRRAFIFGLDPEPRQSQVRPRHRQALRPHRRHAPRRVSPSTLQKVLPRRPQSPVRLRQWRLRAFPLRREQYLDHDTICARSSRRQDDAARTNSGNGASAVKSAAFSMFPRSDHSSSVPRMAFMRYHRRTSGSPKA